MRKRIMKFLKCIKSKLFFNVNIEDLNNAIIEDYKNKSEKINQFSKDELTETKLQFFKKYYKL